MPRHSLRRARKPEEQAVNSRDGLNEAPNNELIEELVEQVDESEVFPPSGEKAGTVGGE